jgi:hypothetical protein
MLGLLKPEDLSSSDPRKKEFECLAFEISCSEKRSRNSERLISSASFCIAGKFKKIARTARVTPGRPIPSAELRRSYHAAVCTDAAVLIPIIAVSASTQNGNEKQLRLLAQSSCQN